MIYILIARCSDMEFGDYHYEFASKSAEDMEKHVIRFARRIAGATANRRSPLPVDPNGLDTTKGPLADLGWRGTDLSFWVDGGPMFRISMYELEVLCEKDSKKLLTT